MGWFDDLKKKPVEQKIVEGAERYQEKHGRPPGVCLVSQKDKDLLPAPQTHVGLIEVQISSYLQPANFMLGDE
jgi:hypothetical protein